MKKILKFNIDYPLLTEIWTYNRMGIISSYPKLYPWELTHNNQLHMDPLFYCSIEDTLNRMHTINYYDEVLHTYEIKHSEDIICQVVNCINNNEYVILDCNAKKLNKYTPLTGVYGLLIYGYDKDRSAFIAPVINKSRTKWIEAFISFDELLSAYSSARESYLNNIDEEFELRRRKNYPNH